MNYKIIIAAFSTLFLAEMGDTPQILSRVAAISFIAIGVWMLVSPSTSSS